MSKIKNIIFDLGGVIINLDIHKTIKEFDKLSKIPFKSIYTQLQQFPVFDLFDKGQISEVTFLSEIKKALKINVSDVDLIYAWNAMLLDFPAHRLALLSQLKSNYRLFLLSNTNETHITCFEKDLYLTHNYKNLEPFFERVYYSCRIGMRKPDTEIFHYVLKENNLLPHETLFIDDSPQHIVGASNANIKAILLEKNQEFESLLKENNLL